MLLNQIAAVAIPLYVWPYVFATAILIVGLVSIIQGKAPQGHGIYRALTFGPLFLALPLAAFSADHFIFLSVVTAMVPSWIPGHLFWALLVGVALSAAALSIVIDKYSVLAATLLSIMLFSFVVLIHLPNLVGFPHERRLLLAILLRDTSFSGGALACAVALAKTWPLPRRKLLTTVARFMIAIPTVFFGVEHFLHPELVTVIPLDRLIPAWMPARGFLVYSTGAILIVTGLSMVFNFKARLAATLLGIVVFINVMVLYLPMTIAYPTSIDDGMNYFADTLLFAGAVLFLAEALGTENRTRASEFTSTAGEVATRDQELAGRMPSQGV